MIFKTNSSFIRCMYQLEVYMLTSDSKDETPEIKNRINIQRKPIALSDCTPEKWAAGIVKYYKDKYPNTYKYEAIKFAITNNFDDYLKDIINLLDFNPKSREIILENALQKKLKTIGYLISGPYNNFQYLGKIQGNNQENFFIRKYFSTNSLSDMDRSMNRR